ncbi:MAG: carbonic anhydrase [Candidatus Latescibacterota bacterium]|nr:MAG: carbonic anhydrase [Candidatus Latescibacterota bacterium]
MNANEALKKLADGNRRFVDGRPTHPHQKPERRAITSSAQQPFAQVLTCSDSRVVPEILFDTGIGDIFVLRVAGNIVDDAVLGSLEYGAAHLNIPLIVVLGHTRCGAVTAAVEGADTGDHITALVESLLPAVEASRSKPGDPVENAVRANVFLETEILRQSEPTLAKLWETRAIQVVGAVYDIGTGEVEWLDLDRSTPE